LWKAAAAQDREEARAVVARARGSQVRRWSLGDVTTSYKALGLFLLALDEGETLEPGLLDVYWRSARGETFTRAVEHMAAGDAEALVLRYIDQVEPGCMSGEYLGLWVKNDLDDKVLPILLRHPSARLAHRVVRLGGLTSMRKAIWKEIRDRCADLPEVAQAFHRLGPWRKMPADADKAEVRKFFEEFGSEP